MLCPAELRARWRCGPPGEIRTRKGPASEAGRCARFPLATGGLILLLFLGVLGAGCEVGGKPEIDPTQTLTQAAGTVQPGQELALDRVVAQPWDRVLVIGPYTPEDEMKKAIGAELPPTLKRIQIDRRDDVHAVVFMQGSTAAAAVALPRRVADFPKSELLRPVRREQAQLVKDPKGVTYRWKAP